MKKGFIYVLFSLIVMMLVLAILFVREISETLEEPIMKLRVEQGSNFLKSVEKDFGRAIRISSRRALISLINEIADKGIAYNNSEALLAELTNKGTLNNTPVALMENSSLQDWISKIRAIGPRSNYNISVHISEIFFEPLNFSLKVFAKTNLLFQDLVANSSFNYTKVYSDIVSIEALEDPLIILNSFGKDFNAFNKCDYPYHAEEILSGTQFTYTRNNWTSGRASITSNPSAVENKSDKIAIVRDLCSFNAGNLSDLEEFEGIISEETVNLSLPCNGAINLKNFIGGALNASNLIRENSLIVMNKESVWENNILDEVDSRCYFIEFGAPVFFDRLENKINKSSEYSNYYGLASFITIPNLPQELRFERSAIDYVYYSNTSFGQNFKIKGVSNYLPWFLMDEMHINSSGIEDLAYS